jgi:hypothetical protein
MKYYYTKEFFIRYTYIKFRSTDRLYSFVKTFDKISVDVFYNFDHKNNIYFNKNTKNIKIFFAKALNL